MVLFIHLTKYKMKHLFLLLSLCCIVGNAFAQWTNHENYTPKLRFIELDIIEKKNTIHVTWTSTMERDGDFFAIERSFNGINFTPLKGALATNLKKPMPYTMLDFEPYRVSYYRIKQTDASGVSNYSSVKKITLNETYFAGAYINPEKSDEIQVLVNLEKQTGVNIIVSDNEEKQLYRVFLPRSTGEEPYIIDMNDFGAGVYVVKISTNDNKYTYTKEVILDE